MTGVQRKDVKRYLEQSHAPHSREGLVARVIGRWLDDPSYKDSKKEPRALTCVGEQSEFYQLVKEVSVDLNPYTVLAELERVAAVVREDDLLSLKERIYIPKGDYQQGFRMLAQDTENLVHAVEENIFSEQLVPNLHLRTEYDNIALEKLPEIRRWLLREGSLFHKKAREFISQFDADVKKPVTPVASGGYVAVGAFSITTGEPDVE